jgi:hypothetical protein
VRQILANDGNPSFVHPPQRFNLIFVVVFVPHLHPRNLVCSNQATYQERPHPRHPTSCRHQSHEGVLYQGDGPFPPGLWDGIPAGITSVYIMAGSQGSAAVGVVVMCTDLLLRPSPPLPPPKCLRQQPPSTELVAGKNRAALIARLAPAVSFWMRTGGVVLKR